MKRKMLPLLLLSGLFVACLFAACKKDDDNGNDNGNHDGDKQSVSIMGFKYDPSPLTINSGVRVTCTNMDDAAHTVTADDDSFTSGTLQKGDTYTHTFTSAGTYKYHCKFHAGMTASVVVQ